MRALLLGVLTLALVHWTAALTCRNTGNVRLVSRTRNGEGRLEVRGTSGRWSSVCPDGWASRSAAVACQELCGVGRYATSVPAEPAFGRGPAIRIFGTQCAGFETSLLQCPHSERRNGQCYEDAGVGLCCHSGCDGRNMFLAPPLRYAVRCDYDSYTVAVLTPPQSGGLIVHPFDIAPLNDPNCFDAQTGHNATLKWMTVPFTKCGVEQDASDPNYVKYKQAVLISSQTTGPAITRLFRYRLQVACGLNRHTNASEWIGSGPANGTEENLGDWNDTMKLDMSIKVYKDADFREEYKLPVKVLVGTPLYVKLAVDRKKLQGGDTGAKIIVEKCTAFPHKGAEENLHHTVINQQLAVDGGTAIDKSPALPEVRFKMQNFKIGINYRELYLSCLAYICPSKDHSTRCKGLPARAQHESGATKQLDENAEFADGPPSGQFRVQSAGYGVELPRFRPGVWGPNDFPNAGLGPDESLRVGRDDGKYYHFKADDSVRLFRDTGEKP